MHTLTFGLLLLALLLPALAVFGQWDADLRREEEALRRARGH